MILEGKVALITGAGRGIGEAISLRFAVEGADVAAADLNEEGARRVSEKVRGVGRRSLAIRTDVASARDVKEMVRQTIDSLGRIDLLVTSAAVSSIVPFVEMTEELWDHTLSVNLKGTFLCCREVIPHMLERGKGKIITLSSVSGRRGATQYAAYCASKFGVIGLTQSIALEFARHGLNINAICPGVVPTELWDPQIEAYAKKRGLTREEAWDYMRERIPLGRFPDLKEIADVALFLASPGSDYMTGQAINVNGGYAMD